MPERNDEPYSRGGLPHAAPRQARNTAGHDERVLTPAETAAYPVFLAPPELPDVDDDTQHR